MNYIFACLVFVLALTAAASFYLRSERQPIQPAVKGGSPADDLPENHPDINSARQIDMLNQAIARDPNNPEYRTQLANLYYDMGQYEAAADHYRRSLDLRPENPGVETDLAACLHYLGQDDNALEMLDKVLAYSPGFSQAMFNKGIILINGKRDVNAGIRVWEDLLRIHPDFAQKDELEQRIDQFRKSIR